METQTPNLPLSVRAVDEAMRRGDLARATVLAGEAAKLGADKPQLLVLATFDCLNRGQSALALEYAARARSVLRRDPEVLNAYALALCQNGRTKEALGVFDAALRAIPDRVSFHYNKACALDDLGYTRRAYAAFERVVELQPNHAVALGRLAYLAVMRGDTAAARRFGESALKFRPDEPAARLSLATAEVADKHYEAALRLSEDLLADPRVVQLNRAIAQGLAGDALDGLGRRREAFDAYVKSNETLRETYRGAFARPGQTGARAMAERLTEFFRDAPAEAWRAEKGKTAQKRTHVFLVGFPRSGTTLLEQVLAAHPDVESMDERDCLTDAQAEFFASSEALSRLAALSSAQCEAWRKAYWRRVGEQDIAPSKKVFIDKLPLNSVSLCLVAKLFPDAKILFALRDPVDVVWSCFRRRFGMNPHMYELLTLDGAARYYDTAMTLSTLYREKLDLDIRDTVYERIVSDFETEVRGICAFLGLAWTDAMTAFAEKARERAPNTPSGLQVAKGLYATAVGQWQSYREELAPILPVLEPWRQRFGYACGC